MAKDYTKPPQRPVADTSALDAAISERFLTPLERRERVRAAMLMRGIPSFNSLAKRMGMYHATLIRSLGRETPPISMLYRLAAQLDVSMNFLTERKLEKKVEKRA